MKRAQKQTVLRLQILARARDLGCEVDFERCEVNAPDGRCFSCGGEGLHTLVFEPWRDDWDPYQHIGERPPARPITLKECVNAYTDVLDRLSYGVEPCHCGDCTAEEA
jgi:hypothetical protein